MNLGKWIVVTFVWCTLGKLRPIRIAEACSRCKQQKTQITDNNQRDSPDKLRINNDQDPSNDDNWWKEEILDNITSVRCNSPSEYFIVPISLSTKQFEGIRNSVDLVARILDEFYPRNDERLLRTFLEKLLKSEKGVSSGRLIWVGNGSLWSPLFYAEVHRPTDGEEEEEEISGSPFLFERQNAVLKDMPWLSERAKRVYEARGSGGERRADDGGRVTRGYWSRPYYFCEKRKWLVSYAAFTYAESRTEKRRVGGRLVGLVSVDVDVSDLNVNQCDTPPENRPLDAEQIPFFIGTHKCHNETSQCIFESGEGWSRGAYKCRCRDGFYSAMGKPVFNGTLVESAWQDKRNARSPSYDILFACKPCQPGCGTCVNDDPCLSHYNWAFRISLLTISIICIILTLILILYVYRYRKLKVIQVASPIFLCITLLGCAIMYAEMAAIFPVLDSYSCVATKWTRHMGFCITYSALLLKTWRVSLTYRVKSAHKLKLTDKQLLHWLFPILLVMAIYLGTWTISSTPVAIYLTDWYHLKFKQCDYNWWDHSLAIGEFLFLLWGIKVCYNVRNAESFFNEAKHITWAVYNITVINLIMLLIHLVILPHAGPDIKYLFGFIRTQMSTTVTTILIFGPKFYRVMKGQGDTWDNRARARGVTASFSLNGVGLMHEDTPDLNQENEELKEEIQKLAAQIEFMKIVHMEMNNRHLKPKHGSFFNQPNATQSPIIKSMYMKFESTDSPGSRISPAAELVSEHV